MRWQIEELEEGRAIQQATVLFNADTGETRAMRTKEDAADYRYFPDPDLPPLVIAPKWVEEIRSQMTELPRLMATRFVADYGLSEYDAAGLTQSRATAAFFEEATRVCQQPKLVSNWILGEMSRRLNSDGLSIERSPVSSGQFGQLITRIQDGTVSNNAAKQVMDVLWSVRGEDVDAVIESKGLKQMNDAVALEKIASEVIAANPKNVAEYKAGNSKTLNALVGQIMKASAGKANPQQVNDLLRKLLD